MPTLVLSSWSLPAAAALADAARRARWSAFALDEEPRRKPRGKAVFYGGADVVLNVATRFSLALLEPPFNLLARVPEEFRHRRVEFGRFADLKRLKAPAFVKPADPFAKSFDAGTY